MARISAVGMLVLLIGCEESYRPAVRDSATRLEPSSADGPEQTDDSAAESIGGDVELAAIRLKAPDTWSRNQPRSQFVAAEFSLPRAEGDTADGRLTISMAGGSVEANLERWRGQFVDKPAQDSEEALDVAGTTVTVVDLSGTFNDQPGPFAPGVKREGYRMIGAVIPVAGQGQLYFVKAYGPEQTPAQHADSIRAFLQTLEAK